MSVRKMILKPTTKNGWITIDGYLKMKQVSGIRNSEKSYKMTRVSKDSLLNIIAPPLIAIPFPQRKKLPILEILK